MSIHQLHETVDAYLTRAYGARQNIVGCHLLQEGISGASLYKVRLPNGEVMLKVTTATRGDLAITRARRELSFYRDLACHISIQVPRVLAMHDDDEAVILVMALYRPTPPPASWPSDDLLEVVRQLGLFHATYWGCTERLAHLAWLAWQQDNDIASDARHAYADWQTLQAQPQFQALLPDETMKRMEVLLSHIDVVGQVRRSLPLTVCHGDCITSNTLRDAEGHFVWTDWQEVRLACGPEDLAFLLNRASTDGATIPRAEMIDTYHQSLSTHAGYPVCLADIVRVMNAAELWVSVLYWPVYLVQAPEHILARIVQRIRELATSLDVPV